ncbi:hypothetical protein OG579_17065 [Williamsia herbipolensis]|uniref:Lsr2 protein n=1 Tax=Williamsia herbipolensis TaxID=1603258 RepID=A0AAU4K090_9NOCA|nr:hypothetical protein [Williamsia herbipolensis]
MSDTVIIEIDTTDGEKYREVLNDLLDHAGDAVSEIQFDTSTDRDGRITAPRDVVESAGLTAHIVTDTDDSATDDDSDSDQGDAGGDSGDNGGGTNTVEEPPRNGKREVWVAFLDEQNVAHDADDDRNELIARWDVYRANTTP